MLLPIDIHPNAASDLKDIKAGDMESWAKLAVLLRELKHDQKLQDRMLQHGQYEESEIGRVEFQKWASQWQKQNELWRVKVYELDKDVQGLAYRIIYAHHPWSQNDPKSYFQILAIVPRSFDYDTESDIARRIIKDYEELREIF